MHPKITLEQLQQKLTLSAFLVSTDADQKLVREIANITRHLPPTAALASAKNLTANINCNDDNDQKIFTYIVSLGACEEKFRNLFKQFLSDKTFVLYLKYWSTIANKFIPNKNLDIKNLKQNRGECRAFIKQELTKLSESLAKIATITTVSNTVTTSLNTAASAKLPEIDWTKIANANQPYVVDLRTGKISYAQPEHLPEFLGALLSPATFRNRSAKQSIPMATDTTPNSSPEIKHEKSGNNPKEKKQLPIFKAMKPHKRSALKTPIHFPTTTTVPTKTYAQIREEEKQKTDEKAKKINEERIAKNLQKKLTQKKNSQPKPQKANNSQTETTVAKSAIVEIIPNKTPKESSSDRDILAARANTPQVTDDKDSHERSTNWYLTAITKIPNNILQTNNIKFYLQSFADTAITVEFINIPDQTDTTATIYYLLNHSLFSTPKVKNDTYHCAVEIKIINDANLDADNIHAALEFLQDHLGQNAIINISAAELTTIQQKLTSRLNENRNENSPKM